MNPTHLIANQIQYRGYNHGDAHVFWADRRGVSWNHKTWFFSYRSYSYECSHPWTIRSMETLPDRQAWSI